jgi:hypothetical protein
MKETIKLLCFIALTVFGCAALWQVRGLARDLRVSVRETDYVLANINTTAINAIEASNTAKEAAIEQKKYWSMTSLQTYKVITDLKGLIVRTDRSINVELVPKLSADLESSNTLIKESTDNLRNTVIRLEPTLDNLARASGNAADVMGDPRIRETLEHVDETSLALAATANHVEATALDMKQVADKFRETYLKPGSTLLAGLKAIIHLVFELRGAVGF